MGINFSFSDRWNVQDFGRTSFLEVDVLQKNLVEVKKEKPEEKDQMLLAEFDPVITKGRQFCPTTLLKKEDFFKSQKVSILDVDRGGEVTYHGPGQLVVYLVADLNRYGKDLKKWVSVIERSLIKLLAEYGVTASKPSDLVGVWVNEKKIASIGIGCRRWITYYGLALNITTDLTPFSWMFPCGLVDVQMTSLEKELGFVKEDLMIDIKRKWVKTFTTVLKEIQI